MYEKKEEVKKKTYKLKFSGESKGIRRIKDQKN